MVWYGGYGFYGPYPTLPYPTIIASQLSIPGPPPTILWWALQLYKKRGLEFYGLPTILPKQIIRGLPYYYILSYPSPDPGIWYGPYNNLPTILPATDYSGPTLPYYYSQPASYPSPALPGYFKGGMLRIESPPFNF